MRRSAPEVQARVAVGLLRLGHLETVTLAEHWLERAAGHGDLLAASTEILLSASALTKLADVEPQQALCLALAYPRSDNAAALIGLFETADAMQRPQILAALGCAGGWHNAPAMSWDDYRYLLAAHESSGVAGAARRLAVDKATIRRRVEVLEEELGCPFVERKASGWEVDEAGRQAVAVAAQMNAIAKPGV